MKKICYCTTIPLTMECFFLESAKYLHEHKGWDISFICSYDEAFLKALPEYIHYYPLDMRRGVNFDGLKVIREMKKIFKREKFDLVQYSTPNASLYASIAARLAKVPVRNYHLMGFRYLGASGVMKKTLKLIEKITCNNSTSIECVSCSNMQKGIEYGLFSSNKATVVWNGSSGGVNLSRFNCCNRSSWRNEIRSKLNLGKDEFVYGFVGRITKDKGINELLEAFLKIKENAKLLIVGDIESEETLNADLLKKAKQSPDVIFHNSVDDIERYYAAMDVLTLPSYREGFGNVVIEAGAVGTPAIVSDIPGPIDAIIKGKTALVVEAKNSEALADAMKNIRQMDYKEMGKTAANFVKNSFDSKLLCDRIMIRKQMLLGESVE